MKDASCALNSIEAAPGGNKVTLAVDHTGSSDSTKLQADAEEFKAIIIELKQDKEWFKQQLAQQQNSLDKLLDHQGPQTNIKDSIVTYSSGGPVTFNAPITLYTSEQIADIKNLFTEIQHQREELEKRLNDHQWNQINEKIGAINAQLNKEGNPDKSIVDPALKGLGDIFKGAGINIATRGLEKLVQILSNLI